MVLMLAHYDLGNLEGAKSTSSKNLSRDPSSVRDSFLFLVASWPKKDITLSSCFFESIRCNLRAILLS